MSHGVSSLGVGSGQVLTGNFKHFGQINVFGSNILNTLNTHIRVKRYMFVCRIFTYELDYFIHVFGRFYEAISSYTPPPLPG